MLKCLNAKFRHMNAYMFGSGFCKKLDCFLWEHCWVPKLLRYWENNGTLNLLSMATAELHRKYIKPLIKKQTLKS